MPSTMLDYPAGYYIIGTRPATSWPYIESFLISGPYLERPSDPPSDLAKVRYWDGACLKKSHPIIHAE